MASVVSKLKQSSITTIVLEPENDELEEGSPIACADEESVAADADVDDAEKDIIPIGNPPVIKEAKDVGSPAAAFAGIVASNAAVDVAMITISALFAFTNARSDCTMMTLPRNMNK
ncbi:hypothetical protein BGZ65_004760 [Modicella reniformis]|uniref:Uncharacterized protein n=1 Tax=Modicella reniformis TaxID=1440133 RepID=A0A9P6MHC2_9FUNG|nr:hypothetical protein BGZ65_004760 [Modicella reniformis]